MKKTVLVADDNASNVLMLQRLCEANGLDVLAADNGEDALKKALARPPDLIVSDILMPVMDGFTLCRQCKSDDRLKSVPFIFYTATYTAAEDEKFALGLGADLFLIKPQDPERLIRILLEFIDRKSPTRSLSANPLGEEMEYFRGHNAALFVKLEKKMADLEIANQNLKAMKERYRLSFENASDLIFMIGADLKVLNMSPSIERILGYAPDEFVGRPVTALTGLFTPASFKQALVDAGRILQGETVSGAIYEFVAKDGTSKFVEVNGSPVIHEGNIVGLISVARDITARKTAEERFKESETRYHDLFEFLPIPVYEMDLEANITAANRAIYDIFGGTEQDIKEGFNAWRLVSPEEAEVSRRNIQRLIRGEQVEATEYSFRRLDGSTFPAIVVSNVITAEGKPKRIRGAIIDITERKKGEERISRTLRATVQAMAAAVEIRDPYTAGHQRRVADLAWTIAIEMGLPPNLSDGLRLAATIHDIGKISVPAELLSKPTKLTPPEFSLIRGHPQAGHDIVKDIEFPWPIARMILEHHERVNGSGYPHGLKGDKLLAESRIMMVADVVEAMASNRPYRPSLGLIAALDEIDKNKGILYDPAPVEACVRLFKEKGYIFDRLFAEGASRFGDI